MSVKIYKPNLHSVIRDKVLDVLESKALKVVNVAAHSHETKRDTGNQENAYGYGVYFDGELKRHGMARVWPAETPAVVKDKEYWGKELVLDFLNSYHPELAGFTVIIVNAMPYSSWQEEGHTPKGKIYRIISQTWRTFTNQIGEIADAFNLKKLRDVTVWRWERNPGDYISMK